jgi:subtilisin family serine protease
MKRLLIIASYIFSILATAHPLLEDRVKIAIIDTGIKSDFEDLSKYMCKFGHYNFVSGNTDVYDSHGHGTNIAWLITRNLDPKKYCLLIYKYYDNSGLGSNNLTNEIKSFKAAIAHDASYINLSGGGDDPAPAEEAVIKDALSRNIRIIVAAGNDRHVLCQPSKYYPACYKTGSPNFYAVGNCKDGEYAESSNRGPDIKQCENGLHQGPERLKMSGTSQSTAIFTNKLVIKESEKKCIK